MFQRARKATECRQSAPLVTGPIRTTVWNTRNGYYLVTMKSILRYALIVFCLSIVGCNSPSAQTRDVKETKDGSEAPADWKDDGSMNGSLKTIMKLSWKDAKLAAAGQSIYDTTLEAFRLLDSVIYILLMGDDTGDDFKLAYNVLTTGKTDLRLKQQLASVHSLAIRFATDTSTQIAIKPHLGLLEHAATRKDWTSARFRAVRSEEARTYLSNLKWDCTIVCMEVLNGIKMELKRIPD